MIFSRFNKPESVPESDFPMEIPKYEMEVSVTKDKQIEKKLVECKEKVNIYEKIQADNHGLDVYDLIRRFNAGDTSIKIGAIDWQDGDFTGTTMSLVEMQAVLETAQAQFESSPLEVRQHYDSDFTKFLNGLETGEFAQWQADYLKANPIPDSKTDQPKEDA